MILIIAKNIITGNPVFNCIVKIESGDAKICRYISLLEVGITGHGQGFNSHLGFLLAAIGSAVGLGNIWSFPYKMGQNGGFAFLFIYLILVFLVGFVIMLVELTLGRRSGLGTVGTYQLLARRFKWVGYFGTISAVFVMGFYCVLGAYCLKYFVINIGDIFGAGFGSAGMSGAQLFETLLHSNWEVLIYVVIFIVVCALILWRGVGSGIEKFSKLAMPVLFVMLVAVVIRSVTLPGASEGVRFMFKPDFTPLKEDFFGVLATAGGQMFFSLSLGQGCMITYGSYLSKRENLEKNALIIPLADTVIALLAGLAVLPAAFALGGADSVMTGPQLLFVTLQDVFEHMGVWGPWFGVAFYLLVLIAALTSALSLLEVMITFFLDKAEFAGKKASRRFYVPIACLVVFLLNLVVVADGLGTNGLWQPGGMNWLRFFNFLAEGILMPLGALFMLLFVGYDFPYNDFSSEIETCGNKFRSKAYVRWAVRYFLPLMILFILYGQLRSFGILP